MTLFFSLIFHVALNLWTGWTVLRLCPGSRSWGESLTACLLLGIYVETLWIGVAGFAGIPMKISTIMMMIGIMIPAIMVWLKKGILMPKLRPGKLKWFEWMVLISIFEKLAFCVWKLTQTPLYFGDAFTHWAGRARSIFGQVNWSFDPASPVFLGFTGNKGYPLGIPIWRAVTANFHGEWNDIIARADGIIFFVAIVAIVWLAVWRFSQNRWLAAGSGFIVSALPLQVWHAAAGYGDIGVEVFSVAAVAALLRREWLLGGILTAGAAWMKNDGLLYLPGLLFMAVLLQFSYEDILNFRWFQKEKWGKVALFFTGIITLIPWWIFKIIYAADIKPGLAPGEGGFSWHADAPPSCGASLSKDHRTTSFGSLFSL